MHNDLDSPVTPDLPFISVIINCYNGATYLCQTLESVLAQSFTDWELIFWDNCSTDNTSTIFKSYTDNRFRYFLAPEHLPLAAAKSLAVDQARGVWLALLDADDLWAPNKLMQQVAIARTSGPELGLVYGKMEVLIEPQASGSGMAKRARARQLELASIQLPEGDVFSKLLCENFIPQPSILVRRDAYSRVGGVDTTMRHAWDYDLTVKVSKYYQIRALQEVCCQYRIHSSNLSQTQGDLCYCESLAIVSRYLPDPAAVSGVKSFQAGYAVHEIRTGRWCSGVMRLIVSGALVEFILRGWHRVRRVLSIHGHSS